MGRAVLTCSRHSRRRNPQYTLGTQVLLWAIDVLMVAAVALVIADILHVLRYAALVFLVVPVAMTLASLLPDDQDPRRQPGGMRR